MIVAIIAIVVVFVLFGCWILNYLIENDIVEDISDIFERIDGKEVEE